MSKYVAIILIHISLVNLSKSVQSVDTNDENHELRNRILSVVDDLFISMKMNQTIIKPKNVDEYMVMHNFMRDVLNKNDEINEQLYNNIETTISNETADKISGVNEVIEEMISEQAPTHNESIHNKNNVSLKLENFADLKDLVKEINVTTKKFTPNNISLWGSNGSQEVDGRRIFAGSTTGIHRYPFMVSVHVAGRFVCAGSLLHESLAISAATCVMRTQDEPTLTVQMRVSSDYVTKEGYLVKVDRLFFHPEFDRSTLTNNLAILKCKKPLHFQKRKVVAIKYDKSDTSLSPNNSVKDIVILGWGRRDPKEKNEIEVRPLSRARLNIYDLEECKYIYTRKYVTDKNFCAGFVHRGEGACNHDGGGPALAGSLLAGVISFGSPRCGRMDAPTVFTRLGSYSDWIERILDGGTKPQFFNIPGSIEIGVPSNETDILEVEMENPKDVLEREFGLKHIINGPIDKPTSKTIQLILKTNEPLHIKQVQPRMKIAEELHSDVDQIKFSDDSEEGRPLNDVDIVDKSSNEGSLKILRANKEITDSHNKTENLMKFTKQLADSSKVRQTGGVIEHVGLKPDTKTTTRTIQASKFPKEKISSSHHVAVTSKVRMTKMVQWDASLHDISKEDLNSLEVYEIQYEIDIKPVAVQKINTHAHQNKTVIILTNSGTSQRFEVKNTKKLKVKLAKRIKKIIQNL